MSSILILLTAAGNWEFAFVFFFKHGTWTIRSGWGIAGGESQQPLPNPCVCVETPVLWPLQLWLDGMVSIITEVEDPKRLRLLEQVGSPVMCMTEIMRKEA